MTTIGRRIAYRFVSRKIFREGIKNTIAQTIIIMVSGTFGNGTHIILVKTG